MGRQLFLVGLACFVAGMATEFTFGAFSKLSALEMECVVPKNDANILLKPYERAPYCDCECNSTNNSSDLSLVEEIIPPVLQPSYAPENLQFEVTRSMIRQSRPIIGNTERLHAYIEKLHDKHCTSVLFMGGSITAGHNARGPENAFPKHFIDWLNERYPCQNDDGTMGVHEMKRTHAQNSQTHFIHWSMVEGIDRIDLVFIEFNVNDHFLNDVPHALEEKGDIVQNNEYVDMWYSEAIIRRLLLLRKPDPCAVVVFNADYVGKTWLTDQFRLSNLFRSNEEPVKLWISSLYEIPVFSASIWMLPLASKLGVKYQFPKEFEELNITHPYSTGDWHADRCCHPHPEGHKILALVLAYCMVEVEKEMLKQKSNNFSEKASIERDFTMQGILRDPVYLSKEEEDMYVQKDSAVEIDIDFTDPNGEDVWKGYVVSMDSWKYYADNADKDKYGLIANSNEGGPHVALAVKGGKFGLVEVSYVLSYENFGLALVWIDNKKENTKEKECTTVLNKGNVNPKTKPGKPEWLIAYWDETASVPNVALLKRRLDEGQEAILHICLTPHNEVTKGSENKFKLLGVRIY